MTENLKLELPNFEGPLDLLLHLIRSNKIDIYDIPIAEITKQYLDYLDKMQKLNLTIAGEYFVMASTLLKLKSQYLLPKNDFYEVPDNEIDDPRQELVGQLVQYSLFKKISLYFKKRNQEVPITVAKEPTVPTNKISPLPKGNISTDELIDAFALVMQKFYMKQPEAAKMQVKKRNTTEIRQKLSCLLDLNKRVSFFKLANSLDGIDNIISLFLITLELCKKGLVTLTQNREYGDIVLERLDNK